MRIGDVTMSWFGWLSLCIELILIFFKTAYLWKDSLRYRYGVNAKTAIGILWGMQIITEIVSEYGGLVGNRHMAEVFVIFIMLFLYLMAENGLEIRGRMQIYWIICYFPWSALELITPLPILDEGNIEYYETPERVLPNLLFILLSFICMNYLWKRKVLHWIPDKLCVIMAVFCLFFECIWLDWLLESEGRNLMYTLKISGIFILFLIIVSCFVMFHSYRQKYKTNLAIQCREQFYHQVCKVRKEAGKFRHDLANHLQVLSTYVKEENVQEKEKYAKKLMERKQELQIPAYSGDAVMDFILHQIKNMASDNGCCLHIQWKAGKVTEEQMENITDECLEYMAKWNHRWNMRKKMGRNSNCQIIILPSKEQGGACRMVRADKKFGKRTYYVSWSNM